MSYTPTVWQTGDIVSSQKLNKLENGVANAGGLVITATESGTTIAFDKTWQEIHDAMASGICCVVVFGDYNADTVTSVSTFQTEDDGLSYLVTAGTTQFLASGPDVYPSLDIGGSGPS